MFNIPVEDLSNKAYQIRKRLIDLTYQAQSGHLDTSLSLVEVWLSLVYSDFFRCDSSNGTWNERDRIFLSEGHACPLQYLINADLGYYPLEDVFNGNRKPHTPFQGHTQRNLKYGFENSNGSLGIGLWQAYGAALEATGRVWCIAGDGEFQEPISFGILMLPHYVRPAGNYTLIVNNNNLAQDSYVDIGPLDKVAELYSWHVQWVDGHNVNNLNSAYQQAVKEANRPSIIFCKTVKGKGGDPQYESKLGMHGRPPKNQDEYNAYMNGLESWRIKK